MTEYILNKWIAGYVNKYLGYQVKKVNSDRCYGLAADNHYLLVCEYGRNGTDPEIILYKKRKLSSNL